MADFLQIFTFGELEIQLNAQTIKSLPTRQVEALLIYLAVTGEEHTRKSLAEFFWNERSQAQSLSNLRASLSRLKAQLGKFLLIKPDSLAINPDANLWLDVNEFSKGLASLKGTRIRSQRWTEEIEQVLTLYHGDFLSGFYLKESNAFEDWLREQREVLRLQLVQGLGQLIDYYLESGDYAQGLRHILRLLRLEPLNEAVHRQYMKLLVQTGQRSAALAQYVTCRQLLAKEMNAEPETLTTDLYQQILAGQMPTTLRPRLDTLPVQASSFLGRETELLEIHRRLDDENCRLLTLLGLGGIGKTRLAYQVAKEQRASFMDGICLVSLAGISNAEQLLVSLADALRFKFSSPNNLKSQLLSYLRDKELLIIFDNCEHLLDELVLVSEILKSTDSIKILATSRESLNIQDEWIFLVEGLPYPGNSADSRHETYAAMALFLQTARRLSQNYEITDTQSLIKICQLVEGMPLALELAASWTGRLALVQIAAQLEEELNLLKTKWRDIPERHRSIRLLFEHSWKLLSEEEQLALMQLSVFQGNIYSEAAHVVGPISLTQLSSLVEKSLLQANTQGAYSLHGLVRRYALEKLETFGQYEATARRHAEYFCEILNGLHQARLTGKAILTEFAKNYENFMATLDWAVLSCQIEIFVQAVRGLGPYWENQMRIQEALHWLQIGFNLITNDTSSELQSIIYMNYGNFQRLQGNQAETISNLEHAVVLAKNAESTEILIEALDLLGMGYLAFIPDFSKAEAIYQELLVLAENMGFVVLIGKAYDNLGKINMWQKNLDLAATQIGKSVALFRQVNAIEFLCTPLCSMGILSAYQQDNVQAEFYFQESLRIARTINSQNHIVMNLINLAELNYRNKNYIEGIPLFLDAFDISRRIGRIEYLFYSVEFLIKLLIAMLRYKEATLLFGAVEHLHQIHNFSKYFMNKEEVTETLKANLGEDHFDLALNRGFQRSVSELLSEIFHSHIAGGG